MPPPCSRYNYAYIVSKYCVHRTHIVYITSIEHDRTYVLSSPKDSQYISLFFHPREKVYYRVVPARKDTYLNTYYTPVVALHVPDSQARTGGQPASHRIGFLYVVNEV